MKKGIFTLFVATATLLSCSSDDSSGSSQDPIIGNWRLTAQSVDGTPLNASELGCDLEEDLIFSSNGEYTSENLVESGNDCVLDELTSGTWSRISSGVYAITNSGETNQVTLSFSNNNNTFTVTETYTDPAQTEVSTYARQ
ncbi:lipocalin-like domain-containing protein [Pseudofulvibacter geojedonensis]|uniref:Lipocalin family protein n=1 Tax=Pseudofulvibacter geojedonensis TaxID=1123758 RepID=A0ABW3I5P6_9FLAO